MPKIIHPPRFTIQNVGPIKKMDVDLADLIILFGYPNTGKSYTMKSIYSSIMLLDEMMLQEIKKSLKGISLQIDKLGFTDESIILEYGKLNFLLDLFYRYNVSLQDKESLAFINEFIRRELKYTKFDPEKNEFELRLSHQLISEQGRYTLSSNLVLEIEKRMKNLIIYEKNSRVLLDGIDFRSFLRTLPGDNDSSGQIELIYRRRPLPRPESENQKYSLIMTRGMRRDDSINLYWNEVKNLNPGEFILDVNLTVQISGTERHVKRPLSEAIKGRINDELKKVNDSRTVFLEEYFSLMNRCIQGITNELIEGNLALAVENLKDYTGISNIRFVPFGRSILIEMLDYITEEPISRKAYLDNSLISDTQGGILLSYLLSAEKGRTVIRNNYEEQQLFIPLLQGRLNVNKDQPIMYNKWDGSSSPLGIASALATEVTGFMLPFLTVRENGMIFIEEPEAQLHPAAQFLMGFTLVALAKSRNVKIMLTTHSDIILSTISVLVQNKPSFDKITTVLQEILPYTIENDYSKVIEYFSHKLSESSNQISARTYWYKEDGSTKEIPITDLGKEIPSITKVYETIANWALSLAFSRN